MGVIVEFTEAKYEPTIRDARPIKSLSAASRAGVNPQQSERCTVCRVLKTNACVFRGFSGRRDDGSRAVRNEDETESLFRIMKYKTGTAQPSANLVND